LPKEEKETTDDNQQQEKEQQKDKEEQPLRLLASGKVDGGKLVKGGWNEVRNKQLNNQKLKYISKGNFQNEKDQSD
ncbi:hypothetical protein HAX54_023167, partial [Datura stramonium]|nr:hypothetical protein [Datura stramonium]